MNNKTKDIIEAFLKVMLCMFCAAFLVSFALVVNIGWFSAALIASATFIQNDIIFMRLKRIEDVLKEKQKLYTTINNEIHIPENIAEILAQKEKAQ